MENVMAIVMAAGKGTRMKSKKSKLVQKIYGKEIIKRAVENAKKSGIDEVVAVVGYMKEDIMEVLGNEVQYAFQEEMLGTGHAVMQATKYLEGKKGKVLVLNGDHPIIRPETLRNLYEESQTRNEAGTILSIYYDQPNMYGKIIHDENGNVEKIVEYKDCNEEELKVKEVNMGMYCFDIEELLKALKEITTDNAQGEYYLTDVIKVMHEKGLKTGSIIVDDYTEMLGINDRVELQVVTKFLQLRINTELMKTGVTIEDINTTYIYDDVKIGKDTIIHPNTTIKSDVEIGEDCEIGPNAYIREGCRIANNAYIGNYVELKNAIVGENTRIPHLSYMGDCEIGANVNVGCGSITCNYDGLQKSKTTIEDNCFIGSNTNFIAPVKIEKDSFIAAGSTITEDVPEGSLAIARERQTNKEGWNKK